MRRLADRFSSPSWMRDDLSNFTTVVVGKAPKVVARFGRSDRRTARGDHLGGHDGGRTAANERLARGLTSQGFSAMA